MKNVVASVKLRQARICYKANFKRSSSASANVLPIPMDWPNKPRTLPVFIGFKIVEDFISPVRIAVVKIRLIY